MSKAINHPGRPAPQFYSHAVEVKTPGRMLFVSGQVATRDDGSVPESIEDQTRQVVSNLTALLAEAGMSAADVVKYTIYLTDERHQPGFVSAAAGLLTQPPPAITLLIVKALADPKYLLEVEAIAIAS
jgi:enamine deaminase RidA (YjgF/YER057c/UK114 family)